MRLQLKTAAKRALRSLLCLAAAPMLMGSECEQPLVKDSGFDVWCGDALCDWQVDAGSVAKVPTWHERDYGVGLLGYTTTISQALPYTSTDVSCIHFDLLANVDEQTEILLTLDFDDGAFQITETIASGAWRPLSYHLVLPSYFQSVRIAITKYGGAGRAELAQIQASKASDCVGPPPLDPLARPAGATCETTSQCAAGRCLSRQNDSLLLPGESPTLVCSDCYLNDCSAGQVCGLAWSTAFLEPFQSCIAPPVPPLVLGTRCLANQECATGSCCSGVCSTCCYYGGAPDCPDGTLCGQRANPDGQPIRIAYQCSPQGRHGAPGTACLSDDDCASGTCAGGDILKVCVDGRRCTSNGDCPMGASGNPCTAIGVAGGQCQ